MKNPFTLFKKEQNQYDEHKEDMKQTGKDTVVEKEEHRHEWQLQSKTYGAPQRNIPSNITDREILEKLLFGVTNFLFYCVICKIFKKEVLLGSEGNRLDDILDLIDAHGTPQYIQRNSITYICSRYIAQGQIPLK